MSVGSSKQHGDIITTLSNAFQDETACGLVSQEVHLKVNLDPRNELMISREELLVNGLSFSSMDHQVAIPRELSTIWSYELGSCKESCGFAPNSHGSFKSLRMAA